MTRKADRWCRSHVEVLFARFNLYPVDNPTNAKSLVLARCLSCGIEHTVGFATLIDNYAYPEPRCRACKLGSNLKFAFPGELPGLGAGLKEAAAQEGHELLKVAPIGATSDTVVVQLRCNLCLRVNIDAWTREDGAVRGWRCACRTNNKAGSKKDITAGKSNALADSSAEAREWWDHDLNDEKLWHTIKALSRKSVHWTCPTQGHRFTQTVADMTRCGPRCPVCTEIEHAQRQACRAKWATMMVADIPELLAGWRDAADPATVRADAVGYDWRCSAGHKIQSTFTMIDYLDRGCPTCRALETRRNTSAPMLSETHPEIASTWHPMKNGALTPDKVKGTSRKNVWWQDPRCGHEWQEPVASRDKYARVRCPGCREILDSLAYEHPEVAATWSERNPVTAWEVRSHATPAFMPWWVCRNDGTHEWQMPLSSRVNGGDCPECREAGKSKVEVAHHEALVELYGAGNVKSGALLRSPHFTRRNRSTWNADILITAADPHAGVAVEYDGAYWHQDKEQIDTDKSLDLLDAGYLVVRLREQPLAPLAVTNPRYREIVVSATTPRPAPVAKQIQEWVNDLSRPLA